MKFILNKELTKKNFDKIFNFIFEKYNITKTLEILESLKLAGLTFATKAGLSLAISDLKSLNKKKLSKPFLNEIKELKVDEIKNDNFNTNTINEVWNNTNETVKKYILTYLSSNDPYNQLIVVLESGARGSREQIHQLVGLRSLMVDHSGSIVPFPIKNSFLDGLTIFEYLLSSFGARKGIIDTALKTADSGYLTRRLIEAAYEIKIISNSCFTYKNYCYKIKGEGKNTIKIKKSVLNCFFAPNLCQNCFILDFSTRKLISLGETVGFLCAQSISEPSTQLTMRTFHTGGVFSGKSSNKKKSNICGFSIFCKKTNRNELTNWKNVKEVINFTNISENIYLNKNYLTHSKKDVTNKTLPFYVGFLNKTKLITRRLIQNNNLLIEYFNPLIGSETLTKKKNYYNIYKKEIIIKLKKNKMFILYSLLKTKFLNFDNIIKINEILINLCINN